MASFYTCYLLEFSKCSKGVSYNPSGVKSGQRNSYISSIKRSSYLLTWYLCFGLAKDFLKRQWAYTTEGFWILI
ncbi:hypothetical protein F2P79_008807 [Pimephales promelas]|nr:hypothetical protein F2P79_008807 [Pimephales promelas]